MHLAERLCRSLGPSSLTAVMLATAAPAAAVTRDINELVQSVQFGATSTFQGFQVVFQVDVGSIDASDVEIHRLDTPERQALTSPHLSVEWDATSLTASVSGFDFGTGIFEVRLPAAFARQRFPFFSDQDFVVIKGYTDAPVITALQTARGSAGTANRLSGVNLTGSRLYVNGVERAATVSADGREMSFTMPGSSVGAATLDVRHPQRGSSNRVVFLYDDADEEVDVQALTPGIARGYRTSPPEVRLEGVQDLGRTLRLSFGCPVTNHLHSVDRGTCGPQLIKDFRIAAVVLAEPRLSVGQLASIVQTAGRTFASYFGASMATPSPSPTPVAASTQESMVAVGVAAGFVDDGFYVDIADRAHSGELVVAVTHDITQGFVVARIQRSSVQDACYAENGTFDGCVEAVGAVLPAGDLANLLTWAATCRGLGIASREAFASQDSFCEINNTSPLFPSLIRFSEAVIQHRIGHDQIGTLWNRRTGTPRYMFPAFLAVPFVEPWEVAQRVGHYVAREGGGL